MSGGREIQSKLAMLLDPKCLLLPKKNHWMRRTIIVLGFIFSDCAATLAFCAAPNQEASIVARMFMQNLGIPSGLTTFVFLSNLPIYVVLSLDSHVIRLPTRVDVAVELTVDFAFAFSIAGPHFYGGSSWFWLAPDSIRYLRGILYYLMMAFVFVRPQKPRYDP